MITSSRKKTLNDGNGQKIMSDTLQEDRSFGVGRFFVPMGFFFQELKMHSISWVHVQGNPRYFRYETLMLS